MDLKVITSVAPYVTRANALEAIQLAYQDGFAGVEHSEDHIHSLVHAKPRSLSRMREYSDDRHMINSIHKTLHRPSIDSDLETERRRAVAYTFKTIDFMEIAGISRMVMHSFSDLPAFFKLKGERANAAGYLIGCSIVKTYGLMAPALKFYRRLRKEKVEQSFMRSLAEIAIYAADKRVDGKPIEIVFEEHYSDAIDYDNISYGRGNLANVIRGVDTAHQLIRTGKNTDLSEISEPIHFHAVDTNGIIDDHRTIGKGKVDFRDCLSRLIDGKLTETIVIEDSTRTSALESKRALHTLIKQAEILSS